MENPRTTTKSYPTAGALYVGDLDASVDEGLLYQIFSRVLPFHRLSFRQRTCVRVHACVVIVWSNRVNSRLPRLGVA